MYKSLICKLPIWAFIYFAMLDVSLLGIYNRDYMRILHWSTWWSRSYEPWAHCYACKLYLHNRALSNIVVTTSSGQPGAYEYMEISYNMSYYHGFVTLQLSMDNLNSVKRPKAEIANEFCTSLMEAKRASNNDWNLTLFQYSQCSPRTGEPLFTSSNTVLFFVCPCHLSVETWTSGLMELWLRSSRHARQWSFCVGTQRSPDCGEKSSCCLWFMTLTMRWSTGTSI